MACWNKPKTGHVHLEPPEDIKELFANPNYSDNNGLMSIDQFRKFLCEFQRENHPIDAEDIIKRQLDHRGITQQQNGLRLDDFFTYLFGDLNLPLPKEVHQDMTAPIAHYFISTRVKIRLFSPRKGPLKPTKMKRNIAAIKEALKMGVRMIQLDLSYIPNKNGGIHNRSHEDLDIRGSLRHYMEAIKENAFKNCDYPMIIAFEGDYDSRIQSHVAEMAQTIFGGKLHNPQVEPQATLSPENLKNKILFTQTPKDHEMEKEERTQKVKNSTKRDASRQANMKMEKDENKEYKSLITFDDVKLKRSLSETLAAKCDSICYFRLTQPKLENAIKTHGSQIVEFTQRNLLTVYPVDKLSGSSNRNPLTSWSHGAQMVAVNTQGHDKYLGVMQGMFRANGGCGYVKKPEILLKGVDDKIFDPKTTLPVKKILKMKIYMGDGWHLDFSAAKFDLLSPPDFFLKVQIFGVTADNAKEETDLEQDKWRPSWNQEFEFPLTIPELALLRIEARDFDDDGSHAFGGQTCLPVWELKSGIRTVPLHNKRGEPYKNVRLLVRFDFIDHK